MTDSLSGMMRWSGDILTHLLHRQNSLVRGLNVHLELLLPPGILSH